MTEFVIPKGWYADGSGFLRPGESTAEGAVRTLLALVGEDHDRDGLRDTPGRVVRALLEMCEGYREDPAKILERVFDEPYADELILAKGIPFSSLCEHHMLPFTGEADVGYIPGTPVSGSRQVVGLSKLARLVDCYAKRLQVQERLTRQVADAIEQYLKPLGTAVVIRASHSCLACRGARKSGVEMVTSAMHGVFREKSEARAEFLMLCGRGA